MRIGIVGAEEAKFTPKGIRAAKGLIRSLLEPGDVVVSGECHLGGIDIWAREIAQELGLMFIGCPPEAHSWEYYKARNIRIAELSDYVVCIAADVYPLDFTGMRFPRCYHCKRDPFSHIKSGGCWTTKYARNHGGYGETLVVNNY